MSYASLFLLLVGLGAEGTAVAPSPLRGDSKSELAICIEQEKGIFELDNCIRKKIDERWEYAEKLHLRLLESESPERRKMLISSRERWIAFWSEENELINLMFPLEDGYTLMAEIARLKLIEDRIASLDFYAQRCTLVEIQPKSGVGTCMPPW